MPYWLPTPPFLAFQGRVALCEAVPKESISSHVLDTVSGEPAQGVALIAYIWENNTWKKIDET